MKYGVWFEVPAQMAGCWKWRGFLSGIDIKTADYFPLSFSKDEAEEWAQRLRSANREATLVEVRAQTGGPDDLTVSRGVVDPPLACEVHGDVVDVLRVGGRYRCGRCAAAASGFQPWFYTGSPYGAEIEALNLPELVQQ